MCVGRSGIVCARHLNLKNEVAFRIMYRLLKLRKLSSSNSQVVSFPVTNSIFTRTCAFCNHSFVLKAPKDAPTLSYIRSTRMQSTNAKIVMQFLSKKKKKSKKKYAELLEVTEDSSIQKKASISELTSKHLSLLAEQPDIDLNELFQLKKTKNHSNDNSKLKFKQQQGALLSIPIEMDSEYAKTVLLKSDIAWLSLQEKCKESSHQKSLIEKESAIENVNDCSAQSCVPCENVGLFKNIDKMKTDILATSDDIASELNFSIDDPELQIELIDDPLNISPNPSVLSLKGTVLVDQFEFQEPDVDNTDVDLVEGNVDTRKQNVRVSKKKDALTPREQAAKMKRKMEENARSESLTRGLSSFMDVCVTCGSLNRALSTLNYYRSQKFKNNPRKLINIKPYNILLQGFARKGNLNKVQEILKMIDEDKFHWSLQTYAAAFECIGRLSQSSTNSLLVKKWMCNLEDVGWTLNDVMVKSIFMADQRESVLKAIRFVLPDFEPDCIPPDTCYSCELLRKLNDCDKKKPYKSPVEGVISRSDLLSAAKKQFEVENNYHVKVKSIEIREEPPEITQFYREKLSEAEASWQKVLTQAFKREIEVLHARRKTMTIKTQLNLFPYLRVLEPNVYIDLLMKEIRRLAEGSETYSQTTVALYRQLGLQVLSRYEVEYKRNQGVLNKIGEVYEKFCDWYTNPTGPACNTREQWQILVHSNPEGSSVDIGKRQWQNAVLILIGKFLYSLILRDIKIDVNIMKPNSKNQHLLPAFYVLFRNHGGVLKEEIKPHPALARLFRSAALEDLVFDVSLVPMLSPPIPWTTASGGVGGYLVSQGDLVRLPHLAFQQKTRMEQCPPNQLYPSLDALNQLGSVPWVVNEPILDLAIQVFNSGGSPRLDIPQPPSACPQPTPVSADMSQKDRAKAFQERLILRRRRAEMYSLWCDTLYRLSLANHYRKCMFWLPHNMDFRGRVYPCPPHLNHLGADMSRSLLEFAQGQPLGPKGLDWLMIHLINLTGLKKRESMDARLEYAQNILPKVLDSADQPLTGEMWWATNEEPWQVLATCMEIAKAIRSGNPETYVSHFPVHQDGSCNGLQHYAALGRDKAGAESVNLAPLSLPQDVYSSVAALVERERSKDAANGIKIAEVLDGFVRRKVIKQTVMTTVYGVTRYGARLQIARQLKDIQDFPKEFVWHGSLYLVTKTFESLREMFTSTKQIQDWFTDCARYIAQVCEKNVEWVTPLGLPVVQPYVRFNYRSGSRSKTQKLNEHFTMDTYEKPNIMKQKNAFPPNFIHSLDSSHMMLTSLFCEREGITFVSVHDCFWTHPCTVDIMNKICREQFVSLHSQSILQDLSEFLCERFGHAGSLQVVPVNSKIVSATVLKQLPTRGNFDLKNVLRSVYFFS